MHLKWNAVTFLLLFSEESVLVFGSKTHMKKETKPFLIVNSFKRPFEFPSLQTFINFLFELINFYF